MSFEKLNLPEELLSAVSKLGYKSPTSIQAEAIPTILEGNDLRASANTGTGKTAAFLLPALKKVMSPPKPGCRGPRVLILVPTRELAMQVSNEAITLSKFLPKIKTVCVYGGVPFFKQKSQLSGKVDLLIATPGRLIDHLGRGKLDLSGVEMFILDEADRMLDMGFFEPVQEIYASFGTPPQTLMFSATLKGAVIKFSKKLLNNPKEISVAGQATERLNIEQRIHFADGLSHKQQLLEHLLSDTIVYQAIVFTATKRFAGELVEKLEEKGHRAAPLHGDMCQRQRSRTMRRMRDGKIRILIATDVAARGLDVQSISHVINFDLPTNAEDYVHRIGRTGRAGAKGVAISLVSSRERQYLRDIEKYTGEAIDIHTIPGMEPKPHKEGQPSRPNGQRKRNNNTKPFRLRGNPGHKRSGFGSGFNGKPENERSGFSSGPNGKPKAKRFGANGKPDHKRFGFNNKPENESSGPNDRPKAKRFGSNGKPAHTRSGFNNKPENEQSGSNDKPKAKRFGPNGKPENKRFESNGRPENKRSGFSSKSKPKQFGSPKRAKSKAFV